MRMVILDCDIASCLAKINRIKMKISYDPKYDVTYLKLTDGKVVDTIEVEKDVVIDYGDQGEMIGIEIINASGQTKINPLHEIVIKIQDEAEA